MKELAQALASIPGVRLGYLFGSRARGKAREDSDYDIAVLLDDRNARADRFSTISRGRPTKQ